MLRGGLLYAYLNSFGVYECPADKIKYDWNVN
jgi:hypothetical protein